MRKSLRWKLQAWYALLLALVLLVFGFLVHGLAKRQQMNDFDKQLIQSARLIGHLHLRPIAARIPIPLPPLSPDPFPEFEAFDKTELYWLVQSYDGQEIVASSPNLKLEDLDFSLPLMHPLIRSRAGNRELLVKTHLANMMVGRSMDVLHDRIHKLGLLLMLVGIFIWGLGLAGGYWLSSRTIRPIESMAMTAESISTNQFSARIDLKKMDSELARLGQVLNDTFDRLENEFEQQARFTADAAHELRTPLSVMRSQCDLALLKPRAKENYIETIENTRDVCDRMNAIVSGLLLLSRIDSDEAKLQRTEVDLYYLMEDSLQGVKDMAHAHGVELSSELNHVHVNVDGNLLQQAVENLLTNAIRYSQSGGRVDMKLMMNGDHALIEIKDTGVGISPDDQDKIFDRFFRVETHRSRETGGAGLGLAICKGIVELHEGKLTVTSELGVGTSMMLSLTQCKPKCKPQSKP